MHDGVLEFWDIAFRTEVPGLRKGSLCIVVFVWVIELIDFAIEQPSYEQPKCLLADVFEDGYRGKLGKLCGHACQESLLDVEWSSFATCVDL